MGLHLPSGVVSCELLTTLDSDEFPEVGERNQRESHRLVRRFEACLLSLLTPEPPPGSCVATLNGAFLRSSSSVYGHQKRET